MTEEVKLRLNHKTKGVDSIFQADRSLLLFSIHLLICFLGLSGNITSPPMARGPFKSMKSRIFSNCKNYLQHSQEKDALHILLVSPRHQSKAEHLLLIQMTENESSCYFTWKNGCKSQLSQQNATTFARYNFIPFTIPTLSFRMERCLVNAAEREKLTLKVFPL